MDTCGLVELSLDITTIESEIWNLVVNYFIDQFKTFILFWSKKLQNVSVWNVRRTWRNYFNLD